MVTNYQVLTDAETAFAALQKETPKPSNPQTGDNTPLVPAMILMLSSVLCLAVLILHKKKYAK